MNGKSCKILVCGAFSTGKTTLVDALAASLSAAGRAVTICPDVARACPLPLNRDQTPETSLWLAAEQIRHEIEAAAGESDMILCDRGLPDILSHHAAITPSANVALDEAFQHFARAWCSTYALVFHAAVDDARPIAKDGVRVADLAYRRMLDTAIRDILSAVGIVPHALPFGAADRLVYARGLLLDEHST